MQFTNVHSRELEKHCEKMRLALRHLDGASDMTDAELCDKGVEILEKADIFTAYRTLFNDATASYNLDGLELSSERVLENSALTYLLSGMADFSLYADETNNVYTFMHNIFCSILEE